MGNYRVAQTNIFQIKAVESGRRYGFDQYTVVCVRYIDAGEFNPIVMLVAIRKTKRKQLSSGGTQSLVRDGTI